MAEIEAGIREERIARNRLGIREAFFGRGNFIRFVIAFVLFFLHQWSGQPSVASYSPQIFSLLSQFQIRDRLLGRQEVLDRVHRNEELSSQFWDLRCFQGCGYGDRHFIPCRESGPEDMLICLCDGNGCHVLRYWCNSQDTPCPHYLA